MKKNNKWVIHIMKFLLTSLFLLFTVYEIQAITANGFEIDRQSEYAVERAQTAAADTGRVIEIRSTGSDLSYDVTEIEAKAGEELTIRYINASDMPHNIVLVKEEADINPVGIAALQAYQNDYIPENEMDRIIAHTELARPGNTVEFTFTVPPPGTYPYICSYPGHFTSMQGRLISIE